MSNRSFGSEAESDAFLRSVCQRFASNHSDFSVVDRRTPPELVAVVSDRVTFRLSYDIRDDYLSVKVFDSVSFTQLIQTKNPLEYLTLNDSALSIASYSRELYALFHNLSFDGSEQCARSILEMLDRFIEGDLQVMDRRVSTRVIIHEKRISSD
jgi:hypothetical protein